MFLDIYFYTQIRVKPEINTDLILASVIREKINFLKYPQVLNIL